MTETAMQTISAKFVKPFYQKNDYSSGLYLVLGQKKDKGFITCSGNGLPRDVCFHKMMGTWKDEKTFRVSKVEGIAPAPSSLENYFKGDAFLGIGRKVIRAMLKEFDSKIFEVLDTEPEKLLNVEGMTPEKLKILVKGYKDSSSMHKLTEALQPVGLSYRQLNLINNALGTDALDTIKENPFNLMDIDGVGFKTCDSIARYYGLSLNSMERVKGGLMEVLKDNSSIGDTYMLDEDMVSMVIKRLNEGLEASIVTREDVIPAVVSLLRSKKIVVEDGHKMMTYEYWLAEENIAKKINAMLKLPVSKKAEMLKKVESYDACRLSNGQMAAVKRSLSSKISVITGGAGTGKTTIEKAIIYAYTNVIGGKVTLLAPTGKASRRMSEATNIEAHTIHSALKLYEGVDKSEVTPISSGLVIVDEFSMVDTSLLDYLMQAVHSCCQVVLIGDINQLPSVGAGACLKDMIESGVVPTSKLTDIFRQEGGSIVDDSLKIVAQQTDLEYDKEMIYVPVQGEDKAIETIKQIYTYYVANLGVENVALISPLRSTQNGRLKCVSDELNNTLQSVINPTGPSYHTSACTFRLNDRVMMWKNTEQASNGDVGKIVRLEENNADWSFEMEVEWENGNTGIYHKNDLDKFTLAYSMSVHKSQGSEWNTVIVPVLSSQVCRLFKNNLLYTAVTRAKKHVILVGDEKAINYMIRHSETYTRKTMLKEKLQKYKEDRNN